MKFTVVGLFAIFFVYQCSTAEAAGVGSRTKRSLALENCPENSTQEECLQYAKEELVKNKSCATFMLTLNTIEWQFCGTMSCTVDGQKLKLIEDLSKPYPDCCPKCDFSNVELSEDSKVSINVNAM